MRMPVDVSIRCIRFTSRGHRGRRDRARRGAHDHRPVGVAVDEDHQHLDAGLEREVDPVVRPGVRLDHPHEPRGERARRGIPRVEVEAHPVAPLLVDRRDLPDLAVRERLHQRRHHPVDLRPRRRPRRAVGLRGAHQARAVDVLLLAAGPALDGHRLHRAVLDLDGQEPLAVEPRVALEREDGPRISRSSSLWRSK